MEKVYRYMSCRRMYKKNVFEKDMSKRQVKMV